MYKLTCLILAVLLFAACQKHVVSSSAQLMVSIDAAIGTVYASHSPDTFLVRIKDASRLSAVPLAYHIAPDASVNPGKRGYAATWKDTASWKDTADLSANNVHAITVTAGNGTTHQYFIAWEYIAENHSIANQVNGGYPLQFFFTGDSTYVATSKGLLASAGNGPGFYLLNTPNLSPTSTSTSNVYCVYAHGSTIYAGIDGGLLISRDGGQHFTTQNYAWGVTCLAVQGDTVYAGTQYGLMVSRDGGNSFDTTTQGIVQHHAGSTPFIRCIAVNGSTVYAGTQDGFYISRDGGRSFVDDNSTLNGVDITYPPVIDMQVRNNSIYLATVNGYANSIDGGKNFTTTGGPGSIYYDGEMDHVAADNAIVCTGAGYWLYISTDKGASFTEYNIDNFGQIDGLTGLAIKGNDIYCGFYNYITIIRFRQ